MKSSFSWSQVRYRNSVPIVSILIFIILFYFIPNCKTQLSPWNFRFSILFSSDELTKDEKEKTWELCCQLIKLPNCPHSSLGSVALPAPNLQNYKLPIRIHQRFLLNVLKFQDTFWNTFHRVRIWSDRIFCLPTLLHNYNPLRTYYCQFVDLVFPPYGLFQVLRNKSRKMKASFIMAGTKSHPRSVKWNHILSQQPLRPYPQK